MYDLIKGEFTKTVTSRTTFVLIGAAIATTALVTASSVLSLPPEGLSGPIRDQMFYFVGTVGLTTFAVIVGARTFTDEFRYGTIVPSVLIAPERLRLLAAKMVSAAVTVLVMTTLGVATLIGVALALAGSKAPGPAVMATDWLAFAGLLGAMFLCAVLGVGIGAIARSQIATVVGALLWLLIIENAASGFIGHTAKFFPGHLAQGMAGVGRSIALMTGLEASLLLTLYVLVGAAIAGASLERRDIL